MPFMKGSLHMPAKKNIAVVLTVIFMLLFSGRAFSKNKTAEKERLKMSGNKISVMNEFLFFPKTNTQKKRSFQTFDIAGNKLSSVELDNEEKEIKKIEYTYDQKNNETSFTEYDGAGNMKQKCESKYDEKTETLTGELFYNAAGAPAYKRVSKPDKAGNIGEQALYDKNNKFIGKSTYKYDNTGNKTDALSYDAANNFNGRYTYGYDRNANLLETLSYDKNNKFSGKKIYNYDQKGLLTESIGYNASGTANSWRKYEYEFRKDQTAAAAVKPPVTETKTPDQPAPDAKTAEVKIAEVKPAEPVKEPAVNNGGGTDTAQAANTQQPQGAKSQEPIDYDNPDVNASMTPADIINIAVVAKPETIKGLAERNSMDLNAQNERGQTALMSAVLGENEKAVEFLLNQGVDLKLKDIAGIDVSYYASLVKNAKIKQLIREHYKK
jgi:hypothetical protein